MSDYQLHHGDCLEILPTLGVGSVDTAICDPPYGLDTLWRGGGWFQRGVYNGAVTWDSVAPQKIVDGLLNFDCVIVIWGGNYFRLPASRCWDVWHKTNNVPTMADIEMCWTNLDKPSKAFVYPCNGWKRNHPTEKPLPLIEWQIRRHTRPGDIILDPFMGSGTTGVAAMHTGRKFIGIELDAGYFQIAQERIERAAQMASGQFVDKRGRAGELDELPLFTT